MLHLNDTQASPWSAGWSKCRAGVGRRCLQQLAVWLVVASSCFGQNPNVLFIAVDDLNNWTGFAGDPNAITPNMDKLAGEGVHFSRAYCNYPLCGPSRASLMSGIYFSELNASQTQPQDAEVEQNIEALGSSLLHTYLGDHGYKTMAVGKILHSHVPSGSVDLSGGREGWDRNEDSGGNIIRSNWPPDLNNETAQTLTDWGIYVGENGVGTEADMSDSKAAAWAVARLQETHNEPFMLMVGFLHPHVPWYVPQSYYDMYTNTFIMPPYDPDDWDDIPSAGLDNINDGYPRTEWAIANNQWTNIVHAYLANVTYADAKIGLVLDALEASPYGTNTIVVLWGDHGYHLGEKNTFQKHTLWDRSGITPLIIRAPGMTTNAACDRVVSLLDLYPTLVDLCELPANDKVRGRTLKPLLEDPALPWDYPAFTYRHGTEAVQYGDLRHIEYEDGSQELYDHASDPDEWTNLVNDVSYAEILEALKNMSPFPPSSTNVFEFVDGSPLDAAGIGASMTAGDVTITTLDVIGQTGTRASGGTGHLTNIGAPDGLGINSFESDKAKNFDSDQGWEFTFNTDVYLQNIDLLEMNAGGTLTIASASFTNIVLTGALNGVNDLGHTFVPSNTLIGVYFTHTGVQGTDGPRIMSLSVVEAADLNYYGAWAVQQGLTNGVNDAYSDDPDGDGMVNLVEYAVGAHSLINDAALYLPYGATSEHNASNYLDFLYRRRIDAEERGLDYEVGSATDLMEEMTNATEEAGSAALDAYFEIVTNRIPTNVEAVQFMRLKITID